MIYIALGSLVSLILITTAYSALLRSVMRASSRREDLLVNQLCALAGRPWQSPPSSEPVPFTDEDLGRFLAIPEREAE